MEYLVKKSDNSIVSQHANVTNSIDLPDGTKSLVGSVRPCDLGDYKLVPSQMYETTSKSANDKEAIFDEIQRLEKLETQEKIAEAILTDEGKTWLQNNRDLIAAEKAKL